MQSNELSSYFTYMYFDYRCLELQKTLTTLLGAKLTSFLFDSRANKTFTVEDRPRGSRVHGAAHSYRTFQRNEGGLLRELRECRHERARVHLICNSYGQSLHTSYKFTHTAPARLLLLGFKFESQI